MHGHVDNDKSNFIVGMFVDAEIVTHSIQSKGLPKEAIIGVDDSNYTLVLDEKNDNEYHFEKVKLNLGKQTEEATEIINSNDLEGKQIVIKGTSMLLNETEDGHSH